MLQKYHYHFDIQIQLGILYVLFAKCGNIYLSSCLNTAIYPLAGTKQWKWKSFFKQKGRAQWDTCFD